MQTRSHFEHASSLRITTIAPNPANGKTLKEHGWRFVIRDMAGNEISQRDPDEVRNEIWQRNGHKA